MNEGDFSCPENRIHAFYTTSTPPMNQLQWYVAYTHSNTEKKVHTRVLNSGIESYLPLQTVKKKWSDRIKTVEVPLFSSYVFVKTTEEQIPRLMGIDGIARFLSFERKYATIKEKEIELIKKIVKDGKDINVERGAYCRGQRVKIKEGPLVGLEGTLIKEQGKSRFLIDIEGLNQMLSISIPVYYFEETSQYSVT